MNDWPPVVTKNLVHIESIDVSVVPLVSSHFARGVNAAGDRVRVERESLLAGQAHGDAAGGGGEPPGALAFALHQGVAAGGLGAHGAVNTLELQRAGAGAHLHVVRSACRQKQLPLRGPSAASARELDDVLSCGHFKSGAAIPDAYLTSGGTVNAEFKYAGLEFSRGHLCAINSGQGCQPRIDLWNGRTKCWF